jgi:hypothetical protein
VTAMVTAPTFELQPGGGDLGLWRADRPLAGVPADLEGETATWHGNVAAVRGLRALRRHIDVASDALPNASGRLLRTLGEAGSGASFGPPGTTRTLEPAERELLAWLDDCSTVDGRVAFGGTEAPGWWSRAERELADLLERLRSWVAPTALVRTTSGDRAVALTAHKWSGRTVTVAAAGASAPELHLHDGLFELVAASRRVVVRVVGLAVEGAVRIGSRLALPGGPLLALPATWRFVHRVLDEVEGVHR